MKTVNDKLEAEVRESLDSRFAKFVVEEGFRNGVYRSWFCHEPGHWDCSFTITTIPGRLIVTGDLGDLIVARCYDMLPWCRGSCDSTGYFAEKVSREIETREFSHERLEEWIREELAEIEQRENEGDSTDRDARNKTLLQDTLDDGLEEKGEEYFRWELSPAYDGGDAPNWSRWKRRFLVLRDAVRWFVNHHSEPPVIEPK